MGGTDVFWHKRHEFSPLAGCSPGLRYLRHFCLPFIFATLVPSSPKPGTFTEARSDSPGFSFAVRLLVRAALSCLACV